MSIISLPLGCFFRYPNMRVIAIKCPSCTANWYRDSKDTVYAMLKRPRVIIQLASCQPSNQITPCHNHLSPTARLHTNHTNRKSTLQRAIIIPTTRRRNHHTIASAYRSFQTVTVHQYTSWVLSSLIMLMINVVVEAQPQWSYKRGQLVTVSDKIQTTNGETNSKAQHFHLLS